MSKVVKKELNKISKLAIVLLISFILLGVCVGCIYLGVILIATLIQGIANNLFSIGELITGRTVGLAVALGSLFICFVGGYSILCFAKEVIGSIFGYVEECE